MTATYWPSPAEFSNQTLKARRLRPRRVAAQGPRKPLHLDGRIRAIDVRAAGPALAIERGGHQVTLPIGRIARIIVVGRVRWDSMAIVQCLACGVPIVFTDPRGQTSGAALPLVARAGDLDELLERFVDTPQWRARYENWLRAQRALLFLRWRRTLPAADAGMLIEVMEFQRAFVHRGETEWLAPTFADAYALVAGVLIRAGVRSQFRSYDGATLALAKNLAELIAARVQMERGNFAQWLTALGAIGARANAAALHDGEEQIVQLLRKLRKTVGEWVEPWA